MFYHWYVDCLLLVHVDLLTNPLVAHHPDGVSEAASSPPPSPATPRANGSMPPAGESLTR